MSLASLGRIKDSRPGWNDIHILPVFRAPGLKLTEGREGDLFVGRVDKLSNSSGRLALEGVVPQVVTVTDLAALAKLLEDAVLG